jgi:hypothetical protein
MTDRLKELEARIKELETHNSFVDEILQSTAGILGWVPDCIINLRMDPPDSCLEKQKRDLHALVARTRERVVRSDKYATSLSNLANLVSEIASKRNPNLELMKMQHYASDLRKRLIESEKDKEPLLN